MPRFVFGQVEMLYPRRWNHKPIQPRGVGPKHLQLREHLVYDELFHLLSGDPGDSGAGTAEPTVVVSLPLRHMALLLARSVGLNTEDSLKL